MILLDGSHLDLSDLLAIAEMGNRSVSVSDARTLARRRARWSMRRPPVMRRFTA
jgi:hypothetical protein